jgi:hypothetical protein
MMVGGIDLIVGPLLTLLVYKQGKKTLKMDLTVIALIQALFLGGGLYTLFASRPVYLVATNQMFNLVFATDILPDDSQKAKNEEITLYASNTVFLAFFVSIYKAPRDPPVRIIVSILSQKVHPLMVESYYIGRISSNFIK